MRFIGNKENLVKNMYSILRSKNIYGEIFCDFFAGTANVGKFFKGLNYKIYSSDILYFSYCLQYAYIKNNTIPKFDKLLDYLNIKNNYLFSDSNLELILEYLNNIDSFEGFIYNNYTIGGTENKEYRRMYFSDENAKKIDAIRIEIDKWKNYNLINDNEYFILIASLIESVSFFSNVSGVYAAFQKKWDKRALKPFILKPINLIINEKENEVFFGNSINIIKNIKTDILYLDPPYNERQYAPNYHILETIARYDNPKIKGVSGMRDYSNQKSSFCNKKTALNDLEFIINNANYKYCILSYNNEGIMEKENIISVMSKVGKVDLIEFDYLKFKSNSNNNKKFIKEQLYILSI
ncbi:DNA adenine methylase [Brachyspira murdochii]|uniref:site-specific DNA-methyltransferase (adenine-specific) n=1 Tax=Brachyspira murdochii (strain ATCC 51284 / DSM 12563 / 56-150) TaxID=526224 RepID=D5UAI1_BRAM5|nr:DNA adenine methylase [Brachyspira murdochii]ADG71704.1 Site-specific DNA-methyltransferase (adenine- specific) [Brachyspira murdochii DSM 12563]